MQFTVETKNKPTPAGMRAKKAKQMKTILIIMALTVSVARAQTNDFASVTVTNSIGDVFNNLTFQRATADGIIFGCKSGIVKARWEQLPEWCQEQYGAAGKEQTQREIEAGVASANLVARTEKAKAEQARVEAALIKARLEEQVRQEAEQKKAVQEQARLHPKQPVEPPVPQGNGHGGFRRVTR